MKNNYIVNDKKIIELITKQTRYSKNRRMFVLEDGTEIVADGSQILIQCHECKQYFAINFAIRYEQKEYNCPHCRVLGKNNPFYGKKHSSEFKNRLSKERKGIWCVGEKNPMYRKNAEDFMTPEAIKLKREKQSTNLKGEKNGMYGKSVKDYVTPEKYEEWKLHIKNSSYPHMPKEKQIEISKKLHDSQLKQQQKNPTKYAELKARGGFASKSKQCNYKMNNIETKIAKFLDLHNVDYDYSCIMGHGEKCFQYDFIIHGKRILIEVQGDYWHGNPDRYNDDGSNGKRKLNDIQKKKRELDKLKKQFAEEKHFKLICIWESEINNDNFSKILEIL